MRFEVSERLRTNRSSDEVLAALEDQFRRISEGCFRAGPTLHVTGIEATFGSINRNDDTTVSVQPTEDGLLLVAEVNYRPSGMFWVFIILLIFTYVAWLVPIVFYLMQKNTVRQAITSCFQRARNEFESAPTPPRPNVTPAVSQLDELGKLAELHRSGVLSDEEFAQQKRKLLEA